MARPREWVDGKVKQQAGNLPGKSNESNLISVVGTLNSQLIACKEELNSVNNIQEEEEKKYMQLKASYVECTIPVWYCYPKSAHNDIPIPMSKHRFSNREHDTTGWHWRE